jgi:hypothetical protein
MTEPGAGIDLKSVKVFGFAASLVFFDPDFPDIDPDPMENNPAGINSNRADPHLYQERKNRGGSWLMMTSLGINYN